MKDKGRTEDQKRYYAEYGAPAGRLTGKRKRGYLKPVEIKPERVNKYKNRGSK